MTLEQQVGVEPVERVLVEQEGVGVAAEEVVLEIQVREETLALPGIQAPQQTHLR